MFVGFWTCLASVKHESDETPLKIGPKLEFEYLEELKHARYFSGAFPIIIKELRHNEKSSLNVKIRAFSQRGFSLT